MVRYIEDCFYNDENSEKCLTSLYDSNKFSESLSRYKSIQEILAFHRSQQKAIRSDDIRAEINKNRKLIITANNECCYICGYDFTDVLIIHHIIPISDGGTNDLDNLAVLCPTCHAIVHKTLSRSDDHEWHHKLKDYYFERQVLKIYNLSLAKNKCVARDA